MADLKITNLVKAFGAVTAVDNVSLTVNEGEFVTLLGPSGCGKSTTLAAIAGLDRPTSGRISLGETVLFDGTSNAFLPPERRNIGLVFQSYALWPHMTVAENLAFPLKLRRIEKAERSRRIEEALDLVEMTAFADRYPFELSGGQQQRVALARTIVYRPNILLLDEPLSNLDAKLRERARIWLHDLQRKLGVTTIYVTHDQAEAMSLSDRIAVMSGGRIVQLGTPKEVFETPATPFVADFIGSSNFLTVQVESRDGGPAGILADGQAIALPEIAAAVPGQSRRIAIRPEWLRLRPFEDARPASVLKGWITGRDYLGVRTLYTVQVGQDSLRVETDEAISGEEVSVYLPAAQTIVYNS
ncbi:MULTISPECIES: ABC transporter ATP-binding protein [unclassified Haematobacter]|uniref:ABC transporter ATP-binding protein n=1 Tax=unclassified Haematobacter TaxID=2640585 RepID=UPI0025BA58CA|nr:MULTISPECIES: ABC transporter ATP-binding protein [unclassified Haematobacter]